MVHGHQISSRNVWITKQFPLILAESARYDNVAEFAPLSAKIIFGFFVAQTDGQHGKLTTELYFDSTSFFHAATLTGQIASKDVHAFENDKQKNAHAPLCGDAWALKTKGKLDRCLWLRWERPIRFGLALGFSENFWMQSRTSPLCVSFPSIHDLIQWVFSICQGVLFSGKGVSPTGCVGNLRGFTFFHRGFHFSKGFHIGCFKLC